MGIAIFVPDIHFSGNGAVTIVGDTAPNSIEINADSSYSASSVQLSVKYTPINTELRGITWSIISGNEYASIDETGKLTINQNVLESDVTVRAVSQADGSVFDEKTITVTYVNPVSVISKVIVRGNPTINTGFRLYDDNDSIEIKYKITDSFGRIGMLWGTRGEESCCYITNNTYVVTMFGCDQTDAETLSTGERHTYRIPTTVGDEYIDDYTISGFTRNGDTVVKYGSQFVGDGFTPSSDIFILHPWYEYAFGEIEIYYFKFKRNGSVTHAFMPAVKDGVYGFYDEDDDIFITNTGESGTITG